MLTLRKLTSLLLTFVAGAALLGPSRPAYADRVVTDITFPIEFFITNQCSGSIITFSLTRRILTIESVDSAGNVHLKIRTTSEGTGVDSITHSQYFFKGHSQEIQNITPGTFSFTDHYTAICPGPEPNFVLDQILHATVNASGQVTEAASDSVSMICN